MPQGDFYLREVAKRSPEIRVRLRGMEQTDSEHVYAISYVIDGHARVSVWRDFEGLVGAVARLEAFVPDTKLDVHHLVVNES